MRQFTLCAGLCGEGRLHEAVHSVRWAVWCEQAARGSSLCVLSCVVWAGCMRQFTLCAGLCGVSRLHEAVRSVC